MYFIPCKKEIGRDGFGGGAEVERHTERRQDGLLHEVAVDVWWGERVSGWVANVEPAAGFGLEVADYGGGFAFWFYVFANLWLWQAVKGRGCGDGDGEGDGVVVLEFLLAGGELGFAAVGTGPVG